MRLPKRLLTIALAIYAVVTVGMLAFAKAETLAEPTWDNHFALAAQSFLAGRLDLLHPPPHGNDFALYDGKHYVVFPPFPALLLAPFVALAGGAEATRDGAFFVALAGAGPALLFLALEKLRRSGQSLRSEREDVALSLLFAFGTVYFFTAVQGTVWFAAHVVAAALAALYLLFSIGAERPLAAGIALALGIATRTPLAFAAPLFVLEAARACVDRRELAARLARFAAPLVALAVLFGWYNAARFDDPLEFGYRYLTVAWQARIEKWGLFSYHYLAKNLGVVLASLPWVPGERGAPFAINYHGLALWVTTPLYALLLWPGRRAPMSAALWAAAIAVALPSLFYQNTGWIQFGYRFSNDYAVFLFALLALSRWSLRGGVALLAAWSLAVNAFGAATFGRRAYEHLYFFEPTQRVIFQPD